MLTGIIITPTNASFPSGTKAIPYTATATFSAGPPQDVTAIADWTSVPDSVADIKSNSGHSNGQVDAKNPGTATITATVPSLPPPNNVGFTTITITVTP
jgi:hypothetical protein